MVRLLGTPGAPAEPPGGLLPAGQVEQVLGGLRGFDPGAVIPLLEELGFKAVIKHIGKLQVRRPPPPTPGVLTRSFPPCS